jgi:endonuclease-3 related protein
MTEPTREALLNIYQRLYANYGPQGWWPGGSAFEVVVGAILTQAAAWTNVEKAT